MFMLFTAVFLSIDALALGFAYGINKTVLSAGSFIIMNLSALTVTYLTFSAGCFIDLMLDDLWSRLFCAAMLTGMGIYIIIGSIPEQDNDCPETPYRLPLPKNLSPFAAVCTGAALSADAAAVCAGLAADGKINAVMPMLIVILQSVFMNIGVLIGGRTDRKLNSKPISFVSGFVIVLFGFYELTPVFL